MDNPKTLAHCLNCSRPETTVPLVNLRYTQTQSWICTQCLPILIHEPQQLMGKLTQVKREDK